MAVTVHIGESGNPTQCRIDGDFFLETAESAESAESTEITETTESAEITKSTSTTAASSSLLSALEQALLTGISVQSVLDAHPESQLIGTNAAAIETAYYRALHSDISLNNHKTTNSTVQEHPALYESRWHSLLPNLTVIHDVPRLPAEQMVTDETWAREVARGTRPPTLRIWEWAAPAVAIGRFQSAPDEVNLDLAEHMGFEVVRRCTGGGAMFIEPGNTITYSLYAPLEFVDGVSIEESYRLCDWWLVSALHELGLDVRFAGLNDIASQHGKIGGAAQRRFPVGRAAHTEVARHEATSARAAHTEMTHNETVHTEAAHTEARQHANTNTANSSAGAVLHHVTMAYDIDAAKMSQVLNTSREKLSDKAVKSAQKRVDPLKSQTGLSREQIIDHLLGWFAAGLRDQLIANKS